MVDKVKRKIMVDMLPEGCIAQVVSLTSPEDACRLSAVGTTFQAAADSDAVWEKFLPLDYKDIISRATAKVKSKLVATKPPQPKSKKQLYFWLSDHPLIIDQGTKSFSLEKKSGKRCYMLAARDLTIIWGDTPRYWRWTSLPDSRFGEVAELMTVCWLEIRGKMNVSLLSPNTTYTAFLVFKSTEEAFGFEYKPAEVSICTRGGETKTRTVYLDTNKGPRPKQGSSMFNNGGGFFNRRMHWLHVWGSREEDKTKVEVKLEEGFYPETRDDGWMEIELGDYFNGNDGEGEKKEDIYRVLEMSLMEVRGGDWKSGLIILGIEIRPKVGNK